MTVSIGSFTVGVAQNYPDLKTAIEDIAATLTGALMFTVKTPFTQTATTWRGSIDLAGHDLTITSDIDPEGVLGAGHTISFTNNGNLIYLANLVNNAVGTSPKVTISNLDFLDTLTSRSNSFIILATNNSGDRVDVDVHSNVFDCRSTVTSGISGAMIHSTASGSSSPKDRLFRIWNNLVVLGKSSSTNGVGLFAFSANVGLSQVEDNSVVFTEDNANNTGYDASTGANTSFRNNLAIGMSLSDRDFVNISSCPGQGNMSDGTGVTDGNWGAGSNNYPSTTMSAEYESVDPDHADFLVPSAASDAADGGSVISIVANTEGVTGNPRPHNTDKYSIGPFEYLVIVAPVITVNPVLTRVAENGPAVFTITATGSAPITYQWQQSPMVEFGDTPVFSNMSGETASTLTIAAAGSSLHQYQYRCVVTNAGGTVNSTAAYLLINGLPDPGAPVSSPDRPTVVLVGVYGLEIVFSVSGVADAFRAEVLDPDSLVAAYSERLGAGSLTVTLPEEGVEYTVSVYAANYGSVAWSLPGYVLVVTVPVTPPAPTPRTPIEAVVVEEPLFSDLDPYLNTDWQGNVLVLTDSKALEAQLENAFGMEPGEVVMKPFVGSDLTKVIGGNVSEAKSDFIRMVVLQTLEGQDKLIIDRAQVEARMEDNEYRIFLEFRDRTTNLKGTLERFVGGENKL